MPAVSHLSPEHLADAAARAEQLAQRFPNATFIGAAQRMRARAEAVKHGVTLNELALAGDSLARAIVGAEGRGA